MSQPAVVSLTPREKQVVQLVADGKTTAQVGAELNICRSTVCTFIESARWKMGATNRTHAAALAIRWGLID